MKALVLAGGEGKRLRPLSNFLPKVLFPICNNPIIQHILSSLAKQKLIDGVVLSLGYLAKRVVDFFSQFNPPLPIEIKVEREPLDTGGAIKFSSPMEDDFFVINGDIICDVDCSAMLDFHKRKGADLTILTVKVKDISPFGSIRFDGSFRIREFREKVGEHGSGFVNGAIYLIKRSILEHFPPGKCSLEREILPLFLSKGMRIFAFLHFGYWMDVGDRERYIQIHKDALDGIAPLECPAHSCKVEGVEIIEPVLLGDNCSLGKGARLSAYAVLGDGVEVGEGTVIEESVVLAGARIGKNCRVVRSIVGWGLIVEDEMILEDKIVG